MSGFSSSPNFVFDPEKSQMLRETRGIGFEEIIVLMETGHLVETTMHPSPQYPHQQLYRVKVGDYIYIVPWVTTVDGRAFLKTIYASRKATRHYKKGTIQ
jgi:hypothetical protein